MESYQAEFVEFMLESEALQFGSFTLKSGRKSPFFMNAGAYTTGAQLQQLGRFYAQAIHDHFGTDFDVVFGPAYKGIPLAVITVEALHELYGVDVSYCSNRKEVKDHGETGILLGAQLHDGDRVLIVEDVCTSGASIDEVMPILKAQADVEVVGLMVSLDRKEVGKSGKISALAEVSEQYGFPTAAIVTMHDVMDHLSESMDVGDDEEVEEVDEVKTSHLPVGERYRVTEVVEHPELHPSGDRPPEEMNDHDVEATHLPVGQLQRAPEADLVTPEEEDAELEGMPHNAITFKSMPEPTTKKEKKAPPKGIYGQLKAYYERYGAPDEEQPV